MTTTRRARAIATAILAAAALGPLALESPAFSSGPPAGFTNAPFESNCTACHSSFPLDSGTANFTISVPEFYQPGAQSLVTVEFGPLTTSTPRHGFQITARNGNEIGVGQWQPTQVGITKNANTSPLHHEQTSAGSFRKSWTMLWTAPLQLPNGPVTFYSCGNEGNGSGSPFGDYIYSTKAKMWQAELASPTLDWAIGAQHVVTLQASAAHAGELAFIVPSNDPTPVNFGGPFTLEVNPFTGFFYLALQSPQTFQNLVSLLDANGHATASVVVPNTPSLIGLSIHFGAITTDASLNPTEVSNRLTVKFQ